MPEWTTGGLLFAILEIIAVGAFGTVCVGRRTEDGEVLALKVVNEQHRKSPSIINRSRDEARILALLRHPNVVRVDKLLHVKGIPVVVMEWVQSINLEALIYACPDGIPAVAALEIARQVFVALDAAWNALDWNGQPMRVIHRDLKPDNLLLSVDGRVKLVDFGIARGEFEDKESITMNMMLGARSFTAPERLDGSVDKPSGDAYSMGLMLFYLLTGTRLKVSLHSGQHRKAVERNLTTLSLEDLDDARTQRVRHLISRLLAYNEAHRPTHEESARTLGGILDGLDPDLPAFGASVVQPIHDKRQIIEPRQHEHWDNVAILEEDLETVDQDLPRPAEQSLTALANQRIRRFLAADDWSTNRVELHRLLDTYPYWSPAPFFTVLDKEAPPWWKFWAGSSKGRERILAVIDALRRRRDDGEVRERLQSLGQHRDPTIARAALDALG